MVTEKSARPRRRTFLIASVLALVVALFTLGAGGPAGAKSQAGQSPRPTIVLVHGDWADASSWTGVIERLQDGASRSSLRPTCCADRPRRAVPRQLPADDHRSDRARRPLLRRVRDHQRRHGQHQRQGARLHRRFMPDEGEIAGGLVAGTRLLRRPESAFNAVPFDGGRGSVPPLGSEPTLPGLHRLFRQRRQTRRRAAVLAADAATGGRRAVLRTLRPPGMEDDPVLVAHRDAGQRDPAGAAGKMSSRAGAHISRVKAGHLSPITRPADVTKVILSAVDATT